MLFVPQPDFGTPPPLDHIEHGLAATSNQHASISSKVVSVTIAGAA